MKIRRARPPSRRLTLEPLEERALLNAAPLDAFVLFRAAAVFPVGREPACVAVGDLNGDGKLDIVTANDKHAHDHTVSVLLGRGNGTFAPHAEFVVDRNPESVALGDLDGDGDLDVVTANASYDSQDVSVLLGNGDGTFAARTDFDVGNFPESVALGDLDGDGDLDVVTANSAETDNTISVLLGNGDGTFAARTDFDVGNFPESVALGDLNGDGDLDVVATNYYGRTVSVLLGNGDGAFNVRADFATGYLPMDVSLGDLDGDGNLDIVTANYSRSVSVLLGSGDGTFEPHVDFATRGQSAAALGDLNGDGFLDIVTAGSSVLLGRGDGTFAASGDYAVGGSPSSVTLGDLDGDGDLDMVTASHGDDSVSVLLGEGDGTFAAPPSFAVGAGPRSVALDDLDHDGDLDVVTANLLGQTVSVLPGNGDGTFAPHAEFPVGVNPRSVALGDLDGEGNSDIVTADYGDNTVSVLLAGGEGTFAPRVDLAVGETPISAALGDVDGDGSLDIVTTNFSYTLGNVSVLLGTGDGAFAPAVNFPAGRTPSGTALDDLDEDGFLDVVTGGGVEVHALLGNGDGTFGPHSDFGGVGASVALGDLDGDGDLDVATADGSAYGQGVVWILLGNGDGTFDPGTRYAAGAQSSSVALGDIDGDGNLDVVTANSTDNTVSVLPGNGDGTFATRRDFIVGDSPYSAAAGDLDGDGDLDVIAANLDDDSVSVLINVSRASGHSPAGETAAPVDAVRFRFEAAMDTSSFSLADDVASFEGPAGPLTPTGFDWLSANTLEVTFAPQAAAGEYQMVIGPEILDDRGRAMDFDRDGAGGEVPDDRHVAAFTIMGPRIVQRMPGAVARAPVDHLDLVFRPPVDSSTFTADDVRLWGPEGEILVGEIALAGVGDGGHTYRVSVPPLEANGRYRLSIGPDLADIGGNLLDQDKDGVGGEPDDDVYQGTFVLDTVGPRIARHSPAGDLAGSVEEVDVWFSEPIRPGTFTVDDVSISGPGGPITPEGVTQVGYNRFRVSFASQTASGPYHVVLGPNVQDRAGNPIDQDRDGVQGETDDDLYRASFSLVDVDLALSNVAVDAAGLWAGEPITVSWEGSNASGAPLLGRWTDAVYFSADDKWDVDDPLLATVPHTGGLAEDGVYAESVTAVVPGALPGDYYLIVRTDLYNQEKEAENEGNNVVVFGPIPLDVRPLAADGTPAGGTLTNADPFDYYAIAVAEGEHLQITLDDADDRGCNGLYIRYGQLPTRSEYDCRHEANLRPDQQAQVPGTEAGVYYVMVYADFVPDAPAVFTISASLLEFGVLGVSPDYGGNTGSVTLAIRGTKFPDDSEVRLIRPDGGSLEPSYQWVRDLSVIYATFPLSGQPEGVYDVSVSSGGGPSATIDGVFTVQPGEAPALDVDLHVPSWIRVWREFAFHVEYRNVSNVDIYAPVIVLEGSQGVSLSPRPGHPAHEGNLCIVGMNSEQPVTILPPGATGRVTAYGIPTDTSGQAEIVVRHVDATNEPFDWDAIEPFVRPDGVSDTDWDPIWQKVLAGMGSGWHEVLPVVAWTIGLGANSSGLDFSFDDALLYDVALLIEDDPGPDLLDLLGPFGALVRELTYDPESDVSLKYDDFDPSAPRTFIITHGLNGNADLPRVQALADRIQAEYPDANVIRVDWRQGAHGYLPGTYGLIPDPWSVARRIDRAANEARRQLMGLGLHNNANTVTWIGESFGNNFNDVVANAWGKADRQIGCNPASALGGAPTPHFKDSSQYSYTFQTYSVFDTNEPIGDRSFFLETPEDRWSPGAQHTYGLEYLAECPQLSFWLDLDVHALPKSPKGFFDGKAKLDGTLETSAFALYFQRLYDDFTQPSPIDDRGSGTFVRSFDPNEKVGPAGAVAGLDFVAPEDVLPYTVYFENDPALASAPAQEVRISDTLDEDLDLSTFELTQIAFADHVIDVPPGRAYYQTKVDLRPEGIPVLVQIEGGLNPDTRQLTATLLAVDPDTGSWPEDPLVGLLYPNDETGRGEGHISYVVRPVSDLPTGTRITNKASIVFDYNDSIQTPLVLNTIDAGLPESSVSLLDAVTTTATFLVEWTGQDDAGGSGVGTCDVYVSDDGGEYVLWLDRTPDTSAEFTGANGHTYAFYSIAIDNVGHREAAPAGADAQTTIELPYTAHMQAVLRAADTGLPVDPNGEADTLPESLEWIDEWDSCWIEIWGRTPDTTGYGIRSFSVDLPYDTDLFTATTIQYGPAFTEGQPPASIDDGTGRVGNINGSTSQTDVGDDQNVLLVRVLFEPTAADPGCPHNADGQYVTPVDDLGLAFEEAQVELVGVGQSTVRLGSQPDTDSWPVIYDVDDDGQVGFGDLAFFATAFQQTVGDPRADFAWACDFDHSSKVDVGDLAFFAENFQRTPGSPMVYPGNFPDDWEDGAQGAAALLALPAPGMQELAAAQSLQAADRESLNDSVLESYADPLEAYSDCLDAEGNVTRLANDLLRYACCLLDFDRMQATSSDSGDTKEVAERVDLLLANGYW